MDGGRIRKAKTSERYTDLLLEDDMMISIKYWIACREGSVWCSS